MNRAAMDVNNQGRREREGYLTLIFILLEINKCFVYF